MRWLHDSVVCVEEGGEEWEGGDVEHSTERKLGGEQEEG
jgi:hypothetical protein